MGNSEGDVNCRELYSSRFISFPRSNICYRGGHRCNRSVSLAYAVTRATLRSRGMPDIVGHGQTRTTGSLEYQRRGRVSYSVRATRSPIAPWRRRKTIETTAQGPNRDLRHVIFCPLNWTGIRIIFFSPCPGPCPVSLLCAPDEYRISLATGLLSFVVSSVSIVFVMKFFPQVPTDSDFYCLLFYGEYFHEFDRSVLLRGEGKRSVAVSLFGGKDC